MSVEKPNRRKLLFKNSIYGLLSWLFPILPAIVVTPIIVKGLGNELYGVYVIILGFISYFFTAGIGKAAAKYVAEYRGSGETEKISDIISSTIILSLMLGACGAALIIIFSRTLVVDVLLIPLESQHNAVIALYLASAIILVGTLSQIFQFVLQGLQRFDRFLLLTNLSSLFFSVGSVIAIVLGKGMLALLVLTLLITLITGIVSYLMTQKLLPEFEFTFRPKSEASRLVWRYAASIIGYQVCGSLLLLFERGWIMRKFGPGALTYYAVPMTLAMYIHLFTSNLVLALFPAVNELLSERHKLVTLYQKSSKLILTLIVFAVVSAVICGKLFLGLWLNGDFAQASYLLLIIHVFTFALLAMNTIVWQVAESFRFASLNAIATLLWMIISIPLMVILSNNLQIQGIALARLTGVFVFIPLIFYVEKHLLGGVFWRFWVNISFRILSAALLSLLAEWIVISEFRAAWPTFFGAIFLGFIVYGAALLIIGFFDSDERQLIRSALPTYR